MSEIRTPALLVIMDGFGLGCDGPGNAVCMANHPAYDRLSKKYLFTTLGASGEDVGLPSGQMGNSEVGHLNIGAGRIVFQELSRINNAVADGTLLENKVLLDCMAKVKAANSKLHIMGLVSNGGVHSSMDHAKALINMAAACGVKKICVDAFTDGRDVPTQSGAGFLADLEAYCRQTSQEFDAQVDIASVSGRYWGMDRDNRWDREEIAYNAIVCGEGKKYATAEEGMLEFYEKDPRGDEFVDPFIVKGDGTHDNDGFIFFNFRPDRARQMTRAMTDVDFSGFDRKKFPQLSDFVTMTVYDPDFHVHVAFPKYIPEHVLADVIADAHLTQLHTAETEKYAHVTFFLNGGVEEPKPGEKRVLIPSPKVATYDLQPEMSEPEVTSELVKAINNDEADLYIVNFANCDMVGHTGEIEATIKATEAVDDGLSQVVSVILAKDGFALVTADHGNAEHIYDIVDGKKKPFTAHTTNRVPLIIVDNHDQELKDDVDSPRLSDIAPTLLYKMGIEIPHEMTGRVLVKQWKNHSGYGSLE